jgi:hypothetical protein
MLLNGRDKRLVQMICLMAIGLTIRKKGCRCSRNKVLEKAVRLITQKRNWLEVNN